MPRLDRLPQINRNTLLTLPAQVNETAPFLALTKPLVDCRLAIVTTAGLHRRGDRLFGPGDQTYRVIPLRHADGGHPPEPHEHRVRSHADHPRPQGALLRRPHGDEAGGGRRRDRALVLG
jgi:hypothetical protein